MTESFANQYGKLSDISDEELYEFLQENENREAHFLAIVCSEVLRRMMEEEFKPNSCED